MLKTLRLGPDEFQTTEENEADVRDVLYAGRWANPPIPDLRQMEHVLDLEPDEGTFACWAWMRFGGPWIDCLLPADEKKVVPHLRKNLPPSGRLIETVPESAKYDVVHAGLQVDAGLIVLERCKPDWYGAEWNKDEDRRRIEGACYASGLRLFKLEMRCVDVGRGLWMRSKAVMIDGNYRLVADDKAA